MNSYRRGFYIRLISYLTIKRNGSVYRPLFQCRMEPSSEATGGSSTADTTARHSYVRKTVFRPNSEAVKHEQFVCFSCINIQATAQIKKKKVAEWKKAKYGKRVSNSLVVSNSCQCDRQKIQRVRELHSVSLKVKSRLQCILHKAEMPFITAQTLKTKLAKSSCFVTEIYKKVEVTALHYISFKGLDLFLCSKICLAISQFDGAVSFLICLFGLFRLLIMNV